MQGVTLYSFRRCPFAMRARLAIAYTEVQVQLREVVLKDKPQQLLDVSKKATVPVLQIDKREARDASVIDESLDIMLWCLELSDPRCWLELKTEQLVLIKQCDFEFKPWLDKYKYADRHLAYPMEYYRDQCRVFLMQLERQLADKGYLFDTNIRLADAAIFPFIRQFAHIDKQWFMDSPYSKVKAWYANLVDSLLFKSIMTKYPPWQQGQAVVLFPEHLKESAD